VLGAFVEASGWAGYGTPPMGWRLVAIGAFLLAGCVWRSYERIMTIHLEVLSGMVNKVVSIADAGQRPTPNDVTELTYPLERAQLFLQQFQSRQREKSYQHFAAFLARYRDFVAAVDNARTDDGRWAGLHARIHDEAAGLQAVIEEIRVDLHPSG